MSRIYYIDSENVGDNWVSLLNTVASEDEILVFFTAKSPHMNYKNLILLKQSQKEVSFIECCEGNNALDFQLCTDLGYRIHETKYNEFIIVSNDTGYDAVVKYWTRRNIQVKRIPGKACSAQLSLMPEPLIPATIKTDSATTANAEPAEPIEKPKTASNAMDARAKEILYIMGKENLQALHEALQQLFGSKKGQTYYNAFKSDTSYSNYINNHQKLSPAEKQDSYCAIVFELSDTQLAMPEGFSKFVTDTWKNKKNLNSFRASLQGEYGKDKSDKYYSLIKAHVKLLDKIK